MNHYKEQYVHDNMHKFVKPTALIEVVKKYYGRKLLAVGTGAQTQEALKILALCGLEHFFTIVVGADQVQKPKPAPDTFLRCAELLGIANNQCVVFEDSIYGLQAAEDADMTAIDVLVTHNIVNDYFL